MVIVNLNKYQILLKTVELGSITRAAEALGYTQSAVSRVIADLEREWDMELLTRSRTGVVLSSSGAALLPYVQAVCNAGRELEEQVAELHGLTRRSRRKNAANGAHAAKQIAPGAGAEAPCLLLPQAKHCSLGQNNRGTYVPPFIVYGKAVAGLGCRLGRS